MPITNRVTEKDLRDYLTGIGYFGRSARVHELELAAIGRPGWLQVFRFHVDAKHEEDGWAEFWGVIRDDERDSFQVRMYETVEERDSQLTEWSDGLLAAGQGTSAVGAVLAGVVVLVLAGLAAMKLMAA